MMLNVYTDAAVNGNPGQAGIGIVLTGNDVYEQLSFPLPGLWDNHTAEFEAIKQAMTWLIDHHLAQQLVFIYSDSKVAVDLLQRGQTKNENYKPYLEEIYALEEHFSYVSIDWHNESSNRGADNLARQGLQKAKKLT